MVTEAGRQPVCCAVSTLSSISLQFCRDWTCAEPRKYRGNKIERSRYPAGPDKAESIDLVDHSTRDCTSELMASRYLFLAHARAVRWKPAPHDDSDESLSGVHGTRVSSKFHLTAYSLATTRPRPWYQNTRPHGLLRS